MERKRRKRKKKRKAGKEKNWKRKRKRKRRKGKGSEGWSGILPKFIITAAKDGRGNSSQTRPL